MIRIAMAGAAGRMGRAILGLALRDKLFKITAGLEQPGHPLIGKDIGPLLGAAPLGAVLLDDAVRLAEKADIIIDFTHPLVTPVLLKAAIKSGTGMVIGTTGLTDNHLKQVRAASKKIPIVQSPNMSIGVNVLFRLASLAGSVLDESYDLEISETHHRMKKDAPSGTAVKLLEVLADARRRNPKKDTVYGREGETGARPKGQIGVFALRGGDVVGDHTVSFMGDGERLELTHRASSRDAFAQGALKAARYLARKRCGLYDMAQVLGLA